MASDTDGPTADEVENGNPMAGGTASPAGSPAPPEPPAVATGDYTGPDRRFSDSGPPPIWAARVPPRRSTDPEPTIEERVEFLEAKVRALEARVYHGADSTDRDPVKPQETWPTAMRA